MSSEGRIPEEGGGGPPCPPNPLLILCMLCDWNAK